MNIKHLLATSLLIISVNSFAQSTFEEGGLVYMEDISDPSKMAVIVMPKQNPVTQWGMYSGDVVVPASIEHDLDTYNVVGLSTMCFMCPDLTGLDIQAPLKTLPLQCIYSEKIKKIKLPDSLEELPNSSIMTPNVEEIYFGKSLKTISGSCMQLNVTNLTIPVTIENISSSFMVCQMLKTLHLKGDNFSTLETSFIDMPALETLSIEGRNLTIAACFGMNIEKLQTLYLSGVVAIKGAFSEINIDKLDLPEGIAEISDSFRTFNGSELTLPNSLTKLENSFYTCPNLKIVRLSKGVCSLENFCKGNGETLYCPWNEVPEVPDLRNRPDFVMTFVVPEGMEARYREAWASSLSRMTKSNITFREEKF